LSIRRNPPARLDDLPKKEPRGSVVAPDRDLYFSAA
jgi:hypothetical protein